MSAHERPPTSSLKRSSPFLQLQVLYCEDSIAIVEGLNNDADVGTALSFASGAKGYAGWRDLHTLSVSLPCKGASWSLSLLGVGWSLLAPALPWADAATHPAPPSALHPASSTL